MKLSDIRQAVFELRKLKQEYPYLAKTLDFAIALATREIPTKPIVNKELYGTMDIDSNRVIWRINMECPYCGVMLAGEDRCANCMQVIDYD